MASSHRSPEPLVCEPEPEREDAGKQAARIKAQAMRDHLFVGDGPYCEHRVGFGPVGSAATGTISGWSACGYPRPERRGLRRTNPGSVNDRWVFVRYRGDVTAKATAPR